MIKKKKTQSHSYEGLETQDQSLEAPLVERPKGMNAELSHARRAEQTEFVLSRPSVRALISGMQAVLS